MFSLLLLLRTGTPHGYGELVGLLLRPTGPADWSLLMRAHPAEPYRWWSPSSGSRQKFSRRSNDRSADLLNASRMTDGSQPAYKSKSFRMFGGADQDRTDDLLNAIQALSQLSYSPPNRTK